jgi:hypothetical protein
VDIRGHDGILDKSRNGVVFYQMVVIGFKNLMHPIRLPLKLGSALYAICLVPFLPARVLNVLYAFHLPV